MKLLLPSMKTAALCILFLTLSAKIASAQALGPFKNVDEKTQACLSLAAYPATVIYYASCVVANEKDPSECDYLKPAKFQYGNGPVDALKTCLAGN